MRAELVLPPLSRVCTLADNRLVAVAGGPLWEMPDDFNEAGGTRHIAETILSIEE
ncbi:MAG: hypothetical protein IID09_01910 [Candidatus Hydrogenedentes bacterium]|nr:hypothetical protein [Candidatus Hydrogenedentota bacterium]